MEWCPDIGFDSYDRFFPSQDTMPAGGFGNLIALPRQKVPRSNGNSVFVDDELRPYDDQWAFLSTLKRLSRAEVDILVEHAVSTEHVIGEHFLFERVIEERLLGVRLPVESPRTSSCRVAGWAPGTGARPPRP